MKKNLAKFFTVFICLIFMITVNLASLSLAYPDEGDCATYHKVQKIIPYYEKDASIQLDGVPNEIFWTEHSNEEENGSLIIPLASEEGGAYQVVVYLNITFVRTDTELYILCQWFDNTTKPDLSSNIYDGLYFCWNINVPNFSAYFTSGMSTLDMGGGDVDSWDWNCLDTSPPNGSSYFCGDKCFGTYGWYNPNLETENVKIGYTYRINHSYTLEMRRDLITNDEYDIQFDKTQLYKFNMGLMNDGTHEDHAISWTYALDLKFDDVGQPLIDGYIISFVYMFMLISIIIYIKKHKFSLKIKNSLNDYGNS